MWIDVYLTWTYNVIYKTFCKFNLKVIYSTRFYTDFIILLQNIGFIDGHPRFIGDWYAEEMQRHGKVLNSRYFVYILLSKIIKL